MVIFLTIIVLLVFGFMALFSYYLYIERYGDSETRERLSETFTEQLSVLSGTKENNSDIIQRPIGSIIQAHNPIFGNAQANITLVVFIDFECPFCRSAFPSFENIRDQYGPAVRIVFKHFPISSIHPRATNAALAAQCAHEQDAFWDYYRLLFEEKQLSDAALVQYAAQLSLNTEKFAGCVASEKYMPHINQDLQDGIAVGVRGTPTYALNQRRLEGVVEPDDWNTAIIELLQTL